MKKLIVIVLVLIILAVVGVAVFLATFDLNRYNQTIASQISAVVGNPVEIGHISLKWKGMIVLELDKFAILEADKGRNTPALSLGRAEMVLEQMPLLKREIKISSINVISPEINLLRSKDGSITVRGYNPRPASKPGVAAASAIPATVDFNIKSIAIRRGLVRFTDLSGAKPSDISIESIDLDIKNVSLSTPMEFLLKAAFLSSRQNVDLSGVLGGFVVGPLYVKDLSAGLDLATIDYARLIKAFPAVSDLGVGPGLSGLAKLRAKEIRIANNKIEKLSIDVDFKEGKLPLTMLKVPIDRISLSAVMTEENISLKSFTANLANASLKSTAEVKDIFATPKTSIRIEAAIPGLKDFLSAISGTKQYIDGKANLSLDAMASGISQSEITRTISGQGVFTMDNGVLLETSLTRETLAAIALYPGLNEKLREFLPAAVIDAMNRQHTLLKPMRQSLIIKDGALNFPDVTVDTDLAMVTGNVRVSLSGELSGSGVMRLSKVLSEGLIKAAPAMIYLAGPDKVIEFPVNFKSSGGVVSAMPDLQYIATKAAMKKGEELVSGLLKKVSKPAQEGQTEGAKPSGEKQGSLSLNDILKNVQTMSQEKEAVSSGASK